MKILVLCSSSHEGVYCEHAVVDVDAGRKETILARRDVFKAIKDRDAEAYDIQFWDYAARFYENLSPEDWLGDEGMAKLETDEWVVLPENVVIPAHEAIRTDCDRLIIDDVSFFWHANDKYCDASFETRRIPYGVLECLRER